MVKCTSKREALLVINLGSPDSTQVSDVKAYLKQFLMDPEVIDIPWMLRYPLVKWLIAPTRAPKSAEAYKKIFSERGSPLVFHTADFTKALKVQLKGQFQEVAFAMRYGSPSISEVVKELKSKGITEIFAVPMYPQFAKSSTRTALNELEKTHFRDVFTTLDFFTEPEFISSYQTQILKAMEAFHPDHLLLSYHGLPESHVKEFGKDHCLKSKLCCDTITEKNRYCYRAQCFATSAHILRGLPQSLSHSLNHTISFQSRLGRQEWIKPYTDREIFEIAKLGKKRVLVACPAFVADCLETLEEIGIRLKQDFINAGGEDLMLVPSLNSEDFWVRSFSEMVLRKKAAFLPLNTALKRFQAPFPGHVASFRGPK